MVLMVGAIRDTGRQQVVLRAVSQVHITTEAQAQEVMAVVVQAQMHDQATLQVALLSSGMHYERSYC